MDQEEQISFVNSLSENHPWLVVQNLDAEDDTGVQNFCSVHDLQSHYHCRIPELLRRRIRNCCHGWVILSTHPHNVEWCLWNPVTSKLITLPRLIKKEGLYNDIEDCYLLSPPDHPGSILLLTRTWQCNFVFCRLDRKRKRLKWIEMSYAKQVEGATGAHGFLNCMTRCNGKVYALANETEGTSRVVCVDIVVKDKEVVIRLLPFLECPEPPLHFETVFDYFLKEYCTELFLVVVCNVASLKTIVDVHLFKLDMTRMVWEEMEDLRNAIFYVDVLLGCPPVCCSAFASELAGYIHIRGESGKVIYSYHVKDKTLSPSSLPCLVETSYVSMCEVPKFRFEGKSCNSKLEPEDMDDGTVVKSVIEFNQTTNDSCLLSIPFHVLETIMELCVGVEYLQFRATCRRCRLAAPPIQWKEKAALSKLHNYSLVSPWLMVFDHVRGIITFTDPLFGDTYFGTKTLPVVSGEKDVIYCSRYGWLLYSSAFKQMVLFNPFTDDIQKLPYAPCHFKIACFSAPPTSRDCIVVGLATQFRMTAWILPLGRSTRWHAIGPNSEVPSAIRSFHFPTFCGRNLYVISNNGKLNVYKDYGENLVWEMVVDEAPGGRCSSDTQYFLATSDELLLLVVMGEIGESVEVFQLNTDSTNEWEKVDDLGRRTIYICDNTCLCVEAKTTEMENKICFPRLHSEGGKIVLYCLETCRYHTLDGTNIQEDLTRTKLDLHPRAWIEPSWS